MTTDITRARALSGPDFDDLSDDEVSSMLAKSERKLGRAFEPSEASYFKAALAARRISLQKLAGIEQPTFTEEMYGAGRMKNTSDQPEGYMGE